MKMPTCSCLPTPLPRLIILYLVTTVVLVMDIVIPLEFLICIVPITTWLLIVHTFFMNHLYFFWWVFYFLVVLLLSSRSYSCGCQVGRESITLNPDCLTLRIIYSGFIYSVLILGTCLNLILNKCLPITVHTLTSLLCFDFPEVVPGLFGMMVRVFFSISLKPRRLCGWSHVFVCTLSLSS